MQVARMQYHCRKKTSQNSTVSKEYRVRTNQHQKRAKTSAPEASVRVAWKESLRFCGPYPVPQKRFYKLETLQNAVYKAMNERDRFLFSSLQSQLGGAPGSLKCDLVYEDAIRLVFHINTSRKTGKQAAFRLVMAKNHEECSKQLLNEYETLKVLHQRAPEQVIEPCGHGVIYLPDRHRRREINREVFGYLTKEAAGLAPLYVASTTQLAPHDLHPLRYSKRDSELLKLALTRLAASLYDEADATGVDPAGLYPECLAACDNGRKADVLMLAQCRQLRKRFYRHKLIHNLLFGTLQTGGAVFPIAPARPERFFQALCDVVPEAKAKTWCQAFLDKAGYMNAHEHEALLPGRDYLAVLQEVIK